MIKQYWQTNFTQNRTNTDAHKNYLLALGWCKATAPPCCITELFIYFDANFGTAGW